MAWSKSSKYQPLADYLAAQPGDEVTLSFAQITTLVGALPTPAAYRRSWWTSGVAIRRMTQSWRAAGWDVTLVTHRDRDWWVTFRRRPAGDAP